MKTEIYIATHKDYAFPDSAGYIPIHVGKALTDLDLGILGDHSGDHISTLNPSFCELTALYWIWKNTDAQILGLVHYRRYFADLDPNQDAILPISHINLDINQIYLIEPVRFFKAQKKILGIYKKKYYYSVAEQFTQAHGEDKWSRLRDVIRVHSPEYLRSFDQVSRSTRGTSFYNMFIMHRQDLDEYCTWLFKILFQCQTVFDLSSYDAYQSRLFGFFSERLLNVFVKQKKMSVKYLPLKMLDQPAMPAN